MLDAVNQVNAAQRAATQQLTERVDSLETEVGALRAELAAVRQELAPFRDSKVLERMLAAEEARAQQPPRPPGIITCIHCRAWMPQFSEICPECRRNPWVEYT